MVFKPIYAMTSDYLILCFYCIIQFGLKENIRKERGHFREHVTEKTTIQKQTKNLQTNNNKKHNQPTNKSKQFFFLDLSTFQIVLYYAFGEINLYIFKL